ncbi:hypothetical protein BD413DRAFT_236273 [Trametes elegans]|nr:hypothetical protein BD413DRAFT_236273 [Trametes elegans]
MRPAHIDKCLQRSTPTSPRPLSSSNTPTSPVRSLLVPPLYRRLGTGSERRQGSEAASCQNRRTDRGDTATARILLDAERPPPQTYAITGVRFERASKGQTVQADAGCDDGASSIDFEPMESRVALLSPPERTRSRAPQRELVLRALPRASREGRARVNPHGPIGPLARARCTEARHGLCSGLVLRFWDEHAGWNERSSGSR